MNDLQQLKNKIIQRILEIDDPKLLKTIDAIFSSSDKNISNFLSFSNEKFQNKDINEVEDFTDYIKEWVKSM
ncbi:hypothetical protein [Lutibacter sp.]